MSNATNWSFRGICLGVPKQQDYDVFKRLIAEVLPHYGCNTLILLVRYRYQFPSHPQVSDEGALTPAQAAEIAVLCRENGIRLIPKMNLLGHQSGTKRGTDLGLLRAYPEFDETPDLDEVRYCRSLCPRHPQVQEVVFDLIDDMLDGFQADAIHVGLDEVFEIGHCPRCTGTPNAELFADWVNALHGHIVGRRQAEMLIWGDRLLDAQPTAYGEWEASANHTWEAIVHIPRDILICDWHYEERDDGYPSIPFFVDQGFRMVVCPWKNPISARLLLDDAAAHRSDKLLGVLATSWCDSGAVARYLCDGDVEVEETPRLVGESFKLAMTFR
ncbi:MAG: family 20 glycosylhydrolase [Anaerolineae bacterium]|nr:family 20 glycosylhydrolase [Anaerolineae bacterium]